MIKKDIIQPINDLIEKRAKELKNKIAYADETEKISYENLNIETKRLSFYLNEKKLKLYLLNLHWLKIKKQKLRRRRRTFIKLWKLKRLNTLRRHGWAA